MDQEDKPTRKILKFWETEILISGTVYKETRIQETRNGREKLFDRVLGCYI